MDALRLAATTVGNMGLSAGDVAAGKGCPASVGGSCGNTTYYDLFGFAVEECVVRCGITVLYWRCGPGLTTVAPVPPPWLTHAARRPASPLP